MIIYDNSIRLDRCANAVTILNWIYILDICFIAPTHLTSGRRMKGDGWEKCTKCSGIQRIQIEIPSNHAISSYCQILSKSCK